MKKHLGSKKNKFHEQVKKIEEIEKDHYLDDIITVGCTVEQVSKLKATPTFQDTKFQLYKWNSNRIQQFIRKITQTEESNEMHPGQKPDTKPNKTKILGIHQGKDWILNTLNQVPERIEVPSSRSIISFKETIQPIYLYVFGDASKDGILAIIYGVTYKHSEMNQMLILSTS